MNRVLSALPIPDGDHYTVVAPKWFTYLLRFVSATFGVATLWLSVRSWDAMPLWVHILVCILVPTFFFMAFHSRGWKRMSSVPFLCANPLGMYFPSTHPRELGSKESPRWLFVPWQNISNLRLDKALTAEGKSSCAAFDVRASADEVKEFFYDDLATKPNARAGHVSVAFYTHMPPHPRKVVTDLVALAKRHHKLFDATRNNVQ